MFFVIGFCTMILGFILVATSSTYYNVHETDIQEKIGNGMGYVGMVMSLGSILVLAWQILP